MIATSNPAIISSMKELLDPNKFRYENAKVGEKVIIRHNVHNMRSQDIIGTIHKIGSNWTDIWVTYFEICAGLTDEDGRRSGDFVTQKFVSTHLERPTALECRKMASHFKRLALEFNGLAQEISGEPPKKKASG